ncbi:ABC transporter substrate-binding protein [Albimonas pacifica]|uniref:Iron complex transport system substrate-binding protein n=1 Tax=Albimonas pacifica TaxID=1114924 RepID=A0A1I3FSQ4_9RHOB|nr:ABC transporter substrate-binding protein [Albimonas pacifica]SFI13951.1 iron complex transport system substrate-binding protein [Albimonas pacifica]
MPLTRETPETDARPGFRIPRPAPGARPGRARGRARGRGAVRRRLATAAVLAIAAGAALAEGAAPVPPGSGAAPRVASVSLCGDQYLLTLADRERIASLSQHATGPHSWKAAEAEGLPRNRGSMEELIAARAGLLIVDREVAPQMRRILDAFGVTPIPLPLREDFEGVFENLRVLAAALGRPERGEAAVADLRARLAAAAPGPGEPRPRVVYYRPDGGGAAAGTFVTAALEAAGYVNLQVEAGQAGWVGLPAEALAVDPPDGYVISYFDAARASAASVLRRNPILERARREAVTVAVPGALWACSGPMLVEAVEILAAARPRFAAAAAARPENGGAGPAPGGRAAAAGPEGPEQAGRAADAVPAGEARR